MSSFIKFFLLHPCALDQHEDFLFVWGVFFYLFVNFSSPMHTLFAVIDTQRDLISILCLVGVSVG